MKKVLYEDFQGYVECLALDDIIIIDTNLPEDKKEQVIKKHGAQEVAQDAVNC